MRKNLFLTLGSLLAIAGLASAAQLNIANNAPITLVGNEDGIALSAADGFVITGSFIGRDNASISSDLMGLEAAFTQFGSDVQVDFETGPGNFAGVFQGTTSQGLNPGDALVGQDVFIVAGEGTNLGDATSLVIYRSSTQFGADEPVFSSNEALGELELVVGTPLDVSIPGGPTVAGVRVIPVPEPSAGLLVALSAFVAISRRKRK